jgi:hypothetical protein
LNKFTITELAESPATRLTPPPAPLHPVQIGVHRLS